MKSRSSPTSRLAQGAAIAALYVVLTLVFAPISFGAMQVRVSEILTILPLFTPAAIPGLFVGCLLANLLGGAVVLDVIFGSLATLIGAALGYANAVIVPLVLRHGYGVDMPLYLMAIYVAAGEIIGCYILGELFATILLRYRGRIFGDNAKS